MANSANKRGKSMAVQLLAPMIIGLLFGSSLDSTASAEANSLEEQRTVTLTGRVLFQGMAEPEAFVYLRQSPASWSQSDDGMRPSPTANIAHTITDARGNFEFKNVKLPGRTFSRETSFPLDVVAGAAGRGLAWRHVEALPSEPLELTVADERKVAGRVIERGDSPVAGVRMRVREIADLGEPLHPELSSPTYLDLESSDFPLAAVTDDEGKFVLRGLPADVRVTLVADDERYLRRETYIATTDTLQRSQIEWPSSPGQGEVHEVPVHLWYSQIEVERAYRVNGRVVLADSGKPAVGAGWSKRPNIGPPDSVTGDDGLFVFRGLRPGKVLFRIAPPTGSGYLGVESVLELSGDDYEVEHTVELPRGNMVHGRVVDGKAGQGIGGATIWYIPQQRLTQYPRPFAEKVQSAADGRFSIAVLTGKAELVVAGRVTGYITHDRSGPVTMAPAEFHRPIDVRPGEAAEHVTFELQAKPNRALTAQVVDAEGQPADGAEVQYQGVREQNGGREPAVRTVCDAKGVCMLSDLDPSLNYELRLIDRRREQGRFVLLPRTGEPQSPLRIELRRLASVSGCVVDEGGQPVAGAVVRLYQTQGQYSHVDVEPVATDGDGRFEFRQLLPGVRHSLKTSCEGFVARSGEPFTPVDGEGHKLGNIVLQRADQEIAGVVVDSSGNPVVGVRVFAFAKLAANLRAQTRTRLTDAGGHFSLVGLPPGDATVLLSYDRFNHRPVILGEVKAGAKDTRFVVADESNPGK